MVIHLGNIPNGLPHFDWPEFSNKDKSFLDMIFSMGSGIIVLPLISSLEDISLCKLFGKIHFYKIFSLTCMLRHQIVALVSFPRAIFIIIPFPRLVLL